MVLLYESVFEKIPQKKYSLRFASRKFSPARYDVRSFNINLRFQPQISVEFVSINYPSEAEAGQSVKVYGDIRNTGNVRAEFQPQLAADGVDAYEWPFSSLDPGVVDYYDMFFIMPAKNISGEVWIESPPNRSP